MSTIFFPLRTGVELFADRRSPAAVTRAKEAALLYDKLIFEGGLYDITITDTGSPSWWLPPDHISPEHLERSREPVPAGAPMQLVMQAEAHRGGPVVGEPHLTMEGTVGIQFVSEFHSGILDELAEFDPDWVEMIMTGSDSLPSTTPIGTAQSRINFQDSFDKSLMPHEDTWRRRFIYQSFNRDSLIAGHFGAAFSITGLFSPMVERRGIRLDHSGGQALDLLLPNVGALPWEAVVEWREHPGSSEARARLREFEERAADSEPEDAQALLKQIAREVINGYEAAYRELLPSLPDELQKELAKTFISFIPGVGPLIEKGSSLAEIVADAVANRRNWVAAMMWLRARA